MSTYLYKLFCPSPCIYYGSLGQRESSSDPQWRLEPQKFSEIYRDISHFHTCFYIILHTCFYIILRLQQKLSNIIYFIFFNKLIKYIKTCLNIQHALGETFCVGVDRVSNYTMQKTEKMVKWEWKSTSDNTVKLITQELDKTSFPALISMFEFIYHVQFFKILNSHISS